MFGLGRRGAGKKKPVVESLDDLKKLQARDEKLFMQVVPAYAEEGNVICQTFLAQASMHMMKSTDDPRLAAHMEERYVKYGTMAAESGNAEEQFNLGIFFFKKFDSNKKYIDDRDVKNFRIAAHWMRKAANARFGPALDCVDDFELLANRYGSDSVQDADDAGQAEDAGKKLASQISGAKDQIEFDQVVSDLAPRNFGDVRGVIEEIGFERAVRFYAHLVRLRISNDAVRWQFILEELDGASQGNAEARNFVRESGIPSEQYSGALDRSWPEVDGPEGPQQMLRQLSMQLMPDRELTVRFTTSIVGIILGDHHNAA